LEWVKALIVNLEGMMMTISTCFIAFRYHLGNLFTTDYLIINLIGDALLICSIFELFDGMQAICTGILQGVGKQKIGMFLNLFAYYICGFPLGFIFAFVFDFKLIGLLSGLTIGFFMNAVILMFYVLFKIDFKFEIQLAAERLKNSAPKMSDKDTSQTELE
jgi:multidrug resistance protein, MATE family